MPKCNTVLQSENDHFVPEIQPNSHGNCKFLALIRTIKTSKCLGIVQLMVKQRPRLCFAFVCDSPKNAGILKFCRFYGVFQWKSHQNSSKIHKMTFWMQS